jgi:hypothetical protein
MEFELEIQEFVGQADEAGCTEIEVSVAGWEVRCRLADSRDLAAIVRCDEEVEGRAVLLRRCVVEARWNGRGWTSGELPANVLEALSKRLEAADPLAVIQLQSTCPECGHTNTAILDPGAVVWSEVRSEADRLLYEVDVLARRYGWTEEEILNLGPRRRRAYLELET